MQSREPNDDSSQGVPQAQLVAIVSPILFALAFGLLKTDAADRILGGGDAGLTVYLFLSGPVALGTAWYLRKAATETQSKGMRDLTRIAAALDVIIGVIGVFALLFALNSGIA